MHSYEPSRARHPYPGYVGHVPGIPGMRPSYETAQERRGHSATPIFDALYNEYRRLFRALPGDRSGEEDLRFDGFGTVRGTGTAQGGWYDERGRRVAALPAALPPGDGHGR
ncbi:hypothetical protein V1J52_13990 [Streptomyces sp. TRM 70351]|uniref:hypothetical protein n=1 Tax=Streptomyces sp. TRM 70351 TaxID=3116552 RepID=UPI002E7C27D9|nr:hypothetical protein [Streptomyces sp. TRM 70351]MEE1929276.1 hypothetical protein [Streptomyces sp. TRM 70351]